MWRPGGGASRLTYRRLQVLIDGLPPESLSKTAARDGLPEHELARLAKMPRRGHGPWSHTDLLLGAIYDQLSWVIYAIPASQGGKPKKPVPLERPGVGAKKKPSRPPLTTEGLAYIQEIRARHVAQQEPPETG